MQAILMLVIVANTHCNLQVEMNIVASII